MKSMWFGLSSLWCVCIFSFLPLRCRSVGFYFPTWSSCTHHTHKEGPRIVQGCTLDSFFCLWSLCMLSSLDIFYDLFSSLQDPSVQQATQSNQRPPGLDDYNPFADGQQATKVRELLVQISTPCAGFLRVFLACSLPPEQARGASLLHSQPSCNPHLQSNLPRTPQQPSTAKQPPKLPRRTSRGGRRSWRGRQQSWLGRRLTCSATSSFRVSDISWTAFSAPSQETSVHHCLLFAARQNNFPPLPSKCPVQPCFYQDFELDIPLEFQKIVKTVYYMWIGESLVNGNPIMLLTGSLFSDHCHSMATAAPTFNAIHTHEYAWCSLVFHVSFTAYVGILFLNLIGSLAYFIADAQEPATAGHSGMTFGLSILYLVLFTPCSFVCWYRPLYKAFRSVWLPLPQSNRCSPSFTSFSGYFCRSDSSLNFFLFFFIFFFQFCVCILQAIAVDGWGTVWVCHPPYLSPQRSIMRNSLCIGVKAGSSWNFVRLINW